MACPDHPHEHEKPQHSDAEAHCHDTNSFDWLLWGSLIIVGMAYALHLSHVGDDYPYIKEFSHASFELMNKMWWGVLLGIFFVGMLGRMPREFIASILGKGGTFSGIVRACLAGVLLDLCSHGILLVGMKLYERGASLGQVMAFLIASPWNSLSLTFIMISLMGAKWTFTFMGLSLVVSIISGLIFEGLVKGDTLPQNPNQTDLPENFRFFAEAKRELKAVNWSFGLVGTMLKEGLADSKMILRWVFLGVVLGAAIRSGVPTEHFAAFFGATLKGLGLTMLAATIIEVCSEGATPIAADLLTRARAPGNSFAFLMAGVATDYTEIMGIKETTRSWKIALFLPLVTLPQVVALSYLLNHFGTK